MNTSSESQQIEFLENQTDIDPTHSVIWLHGLGADGHDFEPIVPQLRLSPAHCVRFIFPHAPMRPITVNNGMVMRGWYDIFDLPLDLQQSRKQDRSGLEASSKIVQALIEQENQRGIATENIFLAGFSQGGAVVLFAGLRLQQKLAGIIALSTYLPVGESTEEEHSEENLSVPIFYGHGTQDPLIPMTVAQLSREKLIALGYEVDWHVYEMPHSVHPREMLQIGAFIQAQMGQK